MRTTFAVGKLTRKTAEIVVAGPWLLRALVRATRPEPATKKTVH